MDKGYGQKAPALEDGTLLIQELRLDAAQSAQVLSDMKGITDATHNAKRTFKVSRWAGMGMNLGLVGFATYYLITPDFISNLSFCLIALSTTVATFGISRWQTAMPTNLTQQILKIIGDSTAATAVFPMFSRFAQGDKDILNSTYIELLLNKESSLGKSKSNLVRLDDTEKNSIVIREIVVP